MRSRRIQQVLWPAFTAVAVGMTLVFMLFSSSHFPRRAVEGCVGIGLVLVGASLWQRTSKSEKRNPETVVDEVVVAIDAGSSTEIILGSETPVANPRLYLEARGRQVAVEDAWHEGVSVLTVPRSTSYWQRGVVYPGVLDETRTLRILLRNEDRVPATVKARVTAYLSKD